MDFVNNYLIPGIISGSIYALAALSITLVFGILRFLNLASGDIMTAGVFGAVVAMSMVGLPIYWAIPVAAATGALTALATDFVVFRPLRERSSSTLLIASFGAALMLRALVLVAFGPQAFSLDRALHIPMDFMGVRVSSKQLAVFFIAIAVSAGIHLLLKYSRVGYAMRAMSENRALSQLCGVHIENTTRWTWVIAGATAGIAGLLLALNAQASPFLGYNLVVPVIAAAILGGLGNAYGAVLGGFVIGIAEELSVYPLFGTDSLISPSYKTAVSFGILILLLLWRPQGLMGSRTMTGR